MLHKTDYGLCCCLCFTFCFFLILVVVGAFIIYTSRALKGLQVAGSFLIVAGFVNIMIIVCIFQYTARLNDEVAMNELVRDVRDAYQYVSNN